MPPRSAAKALAAGWPSMKRWTQTAVVDGFSAAKKKMHVAPLCGTRHAAQPRRRAGKLAIGGAGLFGGPGDHDTFPAPTVIRLQHGGQAGRRKRRSRLLLARHGEASRERAHPSRAMPRATRCATSRGRNSPACPASARPVPRRANLSRLDQDGVNAGPRDHRRARSDPAWFARLLSEASAAAAAADKGGCRKHSGWIARARRQADSA